MLSDATKKTKSALKAGFVIVLALVLVAGLLLVRSSQKQIANLKVNQTALEVEFARSETEKQRGLCCRDSLADNAGMLFIYNQPGRYRFWMKDTRIPLDMFWISGEKKIIYIEQNVQPESYPTSYGPNEPAQYILETNAGFAKKHAIKIGDVVQF